MITALINIKGNDGKFRTARTLIDTAATANFITQKFAELLDLEIQKISIPIEAVEGLSTKSRGSIETMIQSRYLNYERKLTFQPVSHIADKIPCKKIDRRFVKIPKNLKLADPNFHLPAPVDLLLDVGTTLSILCVGQKKLIDPKTKAELCIQKTLLGWVIGGSIPHSLYSETCFFSNEQLDLAKFWELEDGPEQQHLTEEESKCEKFYRETVSRDERGRYVVALPFNSQNSLLGESRNSALKRFEGLQRRLANDATLKEQYTNVLQEYIDLGHMTPISKEQESTPGYYLPHHAVIKQGSLTTKVRVVFDGLAKTSSGISLNDTLMTGPTIQTDLFSLLIRFRYHTYVLTADIEKMYRQFLVRPDDRKFQRIFWTNAENKIQAYELNTVTFGLSAAPYLAIRSLHQLADDEALSFPIASRILKNDLYVDDALTGGATREETMKIRDELTSLLQRGGLNIRQWASNDPTLVKDLPSDTINLQLQEKDATTIKTLGITWNPLHDQIIYSVTLKEQNTRITKRHILSETARIFDPLGLLAPVIIIAKILMQKLWALKLDWDESLPEILHTEWKEYYRKLAALKEVSFNRRTVCPHSQRIELHGFCDASERAYGACVYIRSTDSQGKTTIELIAAKTRVAPLKTVSIPRLELCGALLLTSLYKTIKQALPHSDEAYFWTDSTIVLHWIATPAQKLKTFVANRVAEIQRNSDKITWNHVRTFDNPADLLSRGQQPDEFIASQLWRNGPSWLHSKSEWPQGTLDSPNELPELKGETCLLTTIGSRDETFKTSILTRYSSFEKLTRIIAYCLRFQKSNKTRGPLTVRELRKARGTILRLTQQTTFSTTINDLRNKKEIHKESKLLKLNPFLDDEGLLRVGGRLRNADIPFSERHPIILPKNHHITKLIIQREHQTHLHAGTQTTLHAIRRRYWVIDGKSEVWKIIRKCLRCYKIKPNPPEYIMGDLPASRVNKSRPFSHVGIDYCGPFLLKEKKYRNQKKIKAYVAIFVCLAVKAVHIEIVSDLTTEAFIAALRRFIARRGFCAHIYSDNGTNFVGANNYLRDLMNILRAEGCQKKISEFLSERSIQWHFSSPRTPHFGGLWEAAVRSFKRHLLKVAGIELLLTYEEFHTLATETEAILNSRPLTPLSNDPNDLTALTPSHFLIGEPLTSLHEHDFNEVPTNRLSIWQHLQKIKEDFWARWKREYLNELTSRQKWAKGSHPMKIGSMVLLRDENLPSLYWPLGRVTDVHPGADDVIRTITVRTSKGIYKRGVKAVVLLPFEEPQQSHDPNH